MLAGHRAGGDALAAAHGVRRKCLLPVAGRPMLVRVVEALAASPSVDRLVVSIDEPEALAGLDRLRELRADGRLAVAGSAASPVASALAAAAAIAPLSAAAQALAPPQPQPPPHPRPVLITTADNVLLSPALVEWFCAQARTADADLLVALAKAQALLERYPEVRRTFLELRCGAYTGCNLFAVMAEDGWSVVRFWRRVEAERKRPWRLVRAFGLAPLLRYATGRLTLEDALGVASSRTAARIAAVFPPFPEAAIDVDKESDLVLAERIWAERTLGQGQ